MVAINKRPVTRHKHSSITGRYMTRVKAGGQVVVRRAPRALQPERLDQNLERVVLSPAERAAMIAALKRIDRVAERVGAAWKTNKSALEAVQEQRRDL